MINVKNNLIQNLIISNLNLKIAQMQLYMGHTYTRINLKIKLILTRIYILVYYY